MPRRPNTKNIPSRLFEESASPIFVLDSSRAIVYANESFGNLIGGIQKFKGDEPVGDEASAEQSPSEKSTDSNRSQSFDRESLIGKRLVYQAELQDAFRQRLCAFCPPPNFVQSKSASCELRCAIDGTNFTCVYTRLVDDDGQAFIVGVVCKANVRQPDTNYVTSELLHASIQRFRASQNKRFSQIPFLGISPIARKCFDQATAYAISNSNVSIVGHSQSQIVEIAKAIHFSGFSSLEESDVLLPIDCEVVDGSRVQQIIVDHLQVMAAGESGVQAFVLLLNANHLSELAQRDLLSLQQIPDVEIRWMCTSELPLNEVPDFGSELAARLSTLEIRLPPIADRKPDIAALGQKLLEEQNGDDNLQQFGSFDRKVIEAMQVYSWPGDYRELANVIEHAKKNATSGEIKFDDLPQNIKFAIKAIANPRKEFEPIKMDQVLADFEGEIIARAISACNGNKTNAARLLGITRARLHRKLDEIGGSDV